MCAGVSVCTCACVCVQVCMYACMCTLLYVRCFTYPSFVDCDLTVATMPFCRQDSLGLRRALLSYLELACQWLCLCPFPMPVALATPSLLGPSSDHPWEYVPTEVSNLGHLRAWAELLKPQTHPSGRISPPVFC